ncbi:MAG: MATE family efflux transporter, partial [Lachnospiraceae bacterium]|nr:MATE family efflux transporter [Lachnospiraceae bacterium]
IGRCVGAGDEGLVRYYTRKMMVIAYILQAIFCSITLSTITPVLSLYGLSRETLELTRTLVMLHNGFAILLWPLSFTFPNMLRACNDVRFTMGISVFSMFAFRIVLSIIIGVHFGLGAIGVWIAMIVDWVFRSICFVIRYLHGKWRITGYLVKTQ